MVKYSSFQQEEALKETEKVTEASAQTEVLPTTGDKGSHAVSLDLVCCLLSLDLVENTKVKRKTKKFADKKELTFCLTLCFLLVAVFFDTGLVFDRNSV